MKNVILLTLDTLRKDVLGCYGNSEGLTPFLDSLEDKSIIFNRSHSVGPYTQASFPGILCSSYYLEYGREKNLNSNKVLISEALKKKDVVTAGFHSNPYLSGFFGWNRGWDHYYDSMEDDVIDTCPYIKGDVINQKADEWLSKHVAQQNDKPFFLWAHYMDVHEPYVPSQENIQKIDPSLKLTDDEMMTFFRDVVLTRDASDKDNVDLARKLYKAHVIEIDEYSKGFFDILKKHDVLKDSIVIVTADHGDEFDDHGSLSHDGRFYSELVNVPFIVYDSSLSAGQKSDMLVSGADIPPTIMKLFDFDPDPGFKGRPILPLEDYSSDGIFGEAIGKLSHKVKETDKPAYYCVNDNFKIMYREEDEKWEMYDLEEDPKEKNNIVDSSGAASGMKEKLNAFINRNKSND